MTTPRRRHAPQPGLAALLVLLAGALVVPGCGRRVEKQVIVKEIPAGGTATITVYREAGGPRGAVRDVPVRTVAGRGSPTSAAVSSRGDATGPAASASTARAAAPVSSASARRVLPTATPRTATFKVRGLHCSGPCEERLRTMLGRVPGVVVRSIDAASGEVELELRGVSDELLASSVGGGFFVETP